MAGPNADVDLERRIGQVVRAWRLFRGLSATELAEKAAPVITKPYLSQLERGRVAEPGPTHLKALAGALDLQVRDLLTRRLPDDPPPGPPPDVALAATASTDRASASPTVVEMPDGKFRVTLQPQVLIRIEDLTHEAEGRRIRLEGYTPDGEGRILAEGTISRHTLVIVSNGNVQETSFRVVTIEDATGEL